MSCRLSNQGVSYKASRPNNRYFHQQSKREIVSFLNANMVKILIHALTFHWCHRNIIGGECNEGPPSDAFRRANCK